MHTAILILKRTVRFIFKTVIWGSIVAVVSLFGLLLGLLWGYKGKYR